MDHAKAPVSGIRPDPLAAVAEGGRRVVGKAQYLDDRWLPANMLAGPQETKEPPQLRRTATDVLDRHHHGPFRDLDGLVVAVAEPLLRFDREYLA